MLRSRRFSERYPSTHMGPRYGPSFRAVRRLARQGECVAVRYGYRGRGHEECGRGSRSLNPTAIHLGHYDAEGLLPGCGRFHDLVDGYGSEETVREFETWVRRDLGRSLLSLGQEYVRNTTEVDLDLPD